MKCPICGGEMQEGFLGSGHENCMDTAAGKNKTATEHKGSGAIGKK